LPPSVGRRPAAVARFNNSVYVRGRTRANGSLGRFAGSLAAAPRREDAADEYAALVAAWWKGGYANIEK
jgi:hypothetical protein